MLIRRFQIPTNKSIKYIYFENKNNICVAVDGDTIGLTHLKYSSNNDFQTITENKSLNIFRILDFDRYTEAYQPSDKTIYRLNSDLRLINIFFYQGLEIKFALFHNINKISVSYNGNYLFGITQAKQLIDLYKKEIIMDLDIKHDVNVFAVSDDGKFVAISSYSICYIYLYDIKRKRRFHSEKFIFPINYISFDEDSKKIIAMNIINVVCIIDVEYLHSKVLEPLKMLAMGIVDKNSNIYKNFISHALHDKNLDLLIGKFIY